MSEYLYTFSKRPKAISGKDIHQLAFRMSHARSDLPQDRRDAGRYISQAQRSWEGRTLPTHYIEGDWSEGALVYEATKPITLPYWYDAGPMPGSPKVIGSLVKQGRRWALNPLFDVVRRTCELKNGMLHLQDKDPRWVVTGAGSLPHADAERERRSLNTAEGKDRCHKYELAPDSLFGDPEEDDQAEAAGALAGEKESLAILEETLARRARMIGNLEAKLARKEDQVRALVTGLRRVEKMHRETLAEVKAGAAVVEILEREGTV